MIGSWPAAPDDEAIELPRHAQARERRVRHQREAFPGAIIDDRKNAEAEAIGELVRNKVETPRSFGRRGTSVGALVPIALLRPPRRRAISFSSR
jgi:hypothetical protein